MRLITLNTWGGRAGREKLLRFFSERKDVDIFCLQEIWDAPWEGYDGRAVGGRSFSNSSIVPDLARAIPESLGNRNSYFRPHFMDHYGLMSVVRDEIDVISEGEMFVHKEKGYVPEGDAGNHARNIQFLTVNSNGRFWSVVNFHGLWNGKGKGDSEDRLEQSKRMIEFLSTLSHPYILCGDFNLLPDTKSIKMIEETGLRNLVKEYGITSTRTPLYDKEEKFSDYILVSPGIDVKDFSVLPDVVSDHSPLYLEFEIPRE